MITKTPDIRLDIRGDRVIKDVQKEFTAGYPFLKIEFFRNGNVHKNHYSFDKQIPHHLQIKDAWFRRMNEGELEVDSRMTVSELEQAFMDQFSLSVQVFRKSGNLWLETTITDSWTLKQQNEHGREISTETKRHGSEDSDYDMDRDAAD